MAASKQVRRSVTLPAQIARQVDSIARRRRLSDNRVLLELIEEGMEARRQKEKAFFDLAERFRQSKDRRKSSAWETSWEASSSVSNAANRKLVAPACRPPRTPGHIIQQKEKQGSSRHPVLSKC